MLKLRDTSIQLASQIQNMHKLKNPIYLNNCRNQMNTNAEYFYEVEVGHGNILDQVREGKRLKLSNNNGGSLRLQFVDCNTFLMKKLSVFLEDSHIMYVPKSDQATMHALRMVSSDPIMKFTVLEIGIFEKIVE